MEQLVQTIVLVDEEVEEGAEGRRQMVIKYSEFLAACIDERKVFTREKVVNT